MNERLQPIYCLDSSDQIQRGVISFSVSQWIIELANASPNPYQMVVNMLHTPSLTLTNHQHRIIHSLVLNALSFMDILRGYK